MEEPMNTKRIRLNLLTVWLVVVTVCCMASVALAGPLDRGEMQPRHNPAASSMLRVPGVLGQPERYALETLQQAGLNVNTRYIRQSTEKYAGRNGTVVRQIPSAGGLAMLGSSVTITVYNVEGERETGGSGGDGYGDSGGGDGYGDSGGGDGYGDSGGGDGYGDSGGGDGYGDSGGGDGYGDPGGGDGYGDPGGGDGYGDPGGGDGSPPDDGSSGPDWGSPGSDSGGGGSAP